MRELTTVEQIAVGGGDGGGDDPYLLKLQANNAFECLQRGLGDGGAVLNFFDEAGDNRFISLHPDGTGTFAINSDFSYSTRDANGVTVTTIASDFSMTTRNNNDNSFQVAVNDPGSSVPIALVDVGSNGGIYAQDLGGFALLAPDGSGLIVNNDGTRQTVKNGTPMKQF